MAATREKKKKAKLVRQERICNCLGRHPSGMTGRELAETVKMPLHTMNSDLRELFDGKRVTREEEQGHRDRMRFRWHAVKETELDHDPASVAGDSVVAKNAKRLNRATRWNSNYKETVMVNAQREIRTLLAGFGIESREFEGACFAAFEKAYDVTPRGSRCHNIHLLSLVTIYRTAQAWDKFLPWPRIIEQVHPYTEATLRNVLMVATALTAFPPVDPEKRVRCAVKAIIAANHLTPATRAKVLQILRDDLPRFAGIQTKPEVVAAAIVSTAVLATQSGKPVSEIAQTAGVAPSAVYRVLGYGGDVDGD